MLMCPSYVINIVSAYIKCEHDIHKYNEHNMWEINAYMLNTNIICDTNISKDRPKCCDLLGPINI